MKFWALLIIGAILPFLFASTLRSEIALACLLLTALAAVKSSLRVLCLVPLLFFVTTLAINTRITQRLPDTEIKISHEISGVIGSLPESNEDLVRFVFLPDVTTASVPSKIRVYWYKNRDMDNNTHLPQPRAGERWRLQLELRSPRGRVNFHGFDAERWHFTEGIGALAYVKTGDNERLADPAWFDLNHWRQLVLTRLTEQAGEVPAFQMLAALALADRRGLLAEDKEILSATGTGHLLAISGLHIGLAATLGFYLGRLGLLFLPTGLKQRFAIISPWLLAWLAALAYAALSGFGVSTQRALVMLSLATVVLLSRRNVHPLLAWLIAMAVVLVVDPFAPLRAGFWFSFVAVAVLMMLFVPRYGPLPLWRKMLYAQLGISLVMAPLGMYWFQQASLPGLLANLLAIPTVSLLIVPLILLALLVLWLPLPLAGWLLEVAGHIAHWLFMMLAYLSGLQPAVFNATRVPGLATTLLAVLGAIVLLLPRGVPGRYLGVLLMLPIILPVGHALDARETQIDFLDVGQGLAVLVSNRHYLMVYDTGPGDGSADKTGWDMVAGTLQPMIRATGKSPDLVVVSHADLDHAGGLERLHAKYPDAQYLASLPEQRNNIDICRTPQSWTADTLRFEVLHPSIGLPYLGNDSSCVISVTGPRFQLLLSGDISQVVEQRLLDNGIQRHTVLTVPHHGSSTSSSQALINAVKPSLALVSTAANNRFGFPRADVLNRYSKAGIPILDTAKCGGIRIIIDADGHFTLETARVSRKSIWRWPADKSCLNAR